jgi:hypothetical protein
VCGSIHASFLALYGHSALCLVRSRAMCTIPPHIGAALCKGMLAEEWARAQEEEERYLSSRQERWREALARAAAAAEAGGEADDTDVEELMVSCLQCAQKCDYPFVP